MPDAFIYDHVRTPRGRGKADGALHEVTALNLAAQTLGAIKDRNKLDTKMIDDVVLGCVDPVGSPNLCSPSERLGSAWTHGLRRIFSEAQVF